LAAEKGLGPQAQKDDDGHKEDQDDKLLAVDQVVPAAGEPGQGRRVFLALLRRADLDHAITSRLYHD
jgi:hypothetical protein